MPRLVNQVPKYRKHRQSGQAVVTIGGKDYYLGPHGTKASKVEYDRLVGEWLAAGRPVTLKPENDISVAEVIARFWKWANIHYVKDGVSTGTADNFRPILRVLKSVYGRTPAKDFGPLALKAIVARLIAEGQSRRYANDNMARVKKIFTWAASEQLVPVAVSQALSTVSGLEKGRTQARETAPIQPVDDATVDATLPHLSPIVADMIRLQRLTGMRPGEVCILRPCDVDTSGEVWTYTPHSHKTEHHGKARVVCIGPKGQDVLRPYLLRAKDDFCFKPSESERKRNARRREERQTPMTPSQAKRRAKRYRSTPPGDHYTNDSYRRAIHRACEKAKQPRWAPNQIRHTAATAIRRKFGLEAAQVALGHSRADVTQIYAEKNLSLAADVAREVG